VWYDSRYCRVLAPNLQRNHISHRRNGNHLELSIRRRRVRTSHFYQGTKQAFAGTDELDTLSGDPGANDGSFPLKNLFHTKVLRYYRTV